MEGKAVLQEDFAGVGCIACIIEDYAGVVDSEHEMWSSTIQIRPLAISRSFLEAHSSVTWEADLIDALQRC